MSGSDQGDKKIRTIDWDEYSRLCRLLANKALERHKVDTVVGIAHGGVIVGATLATILGRDFFPIKFSRRVNSRVVRKKSKLLVPPTADLKDKVVLLIDDVTNTGETMKAALEAIKARSPAEVLTLSLVRKSAYETDFVGTYFPGQVILPWQIEDDPRNGGKGANGNRVIKEIYE